MQGTSWRKTRCFLALLVVLTAHGCGGGGSGGSKPNAPTPTPAPTPSSAEAVQGAASVGPSTLVATAALLSAISIGAPSGGAAALLPSEPARTWFRALWDDVLAAAAASPDEQSGQGTAAARGTCAHGGTLSSTCRRQGGKSTITASLAGCGIVDPSTDHILIATGGLTVTVAAPSVCSTGVVPPDATLTTQYRNLNVTVTDPGGGIRERFSTTLSETFIPQGAGCASTNGSATVSGSVTDKSMINGADVALTARNLVADLVSTGTPCAQQVTLNGALTVEDRHAAVRVAERLHDLEVTFTDANAPMVVGTLAGTMSTDCLGDIEWETVMPLMVPQTAVCPTAGVLAVRRADGTDGRVEFTTNQGIAIDVNADGTVDTTLPDCSGHGPCTD